MATGDKLVKLDDLKLVYDKLHVPSVQLQITTGQWSGNGPYTYSANVTNVDANTSVEMEMDETINYLTADLKVTTGSGSITLSTASKPSNTVNVTLFFPGVQSEVNVQVLADVYSKSQTDTLLAAKVSTSNIVNNLTSTATNQPLSANMGKTLEEHISAISLTPYVASIPTGQWSGSGSDRYITVQASNVTADSILIPSYDSTSQSRLNGPVWCVPAAGSFTIHTTAIPSNTVNIMVQFVGTLGTAQYQVLPDVYSKSQTDALVAQSTAKLKRITVTGVNSTNFMVTGIMAANGITPSKVLGVYINSDSGFSQQPISVFYNNIAADNLYIRTATAPTSGTLNITVAYLD